ncbi:dipeptide/oligopeptide/nickel ABC transporter permease/ATP-binding protein [Microvirga sp. P5_D2]
MAEPGPAVMSPSQSKAKRRRGLGPLAALVRQPKGLVGLVIVGMCAILAVAGPWMAPLDPYAQNFAQTLKGPSAVHWFGTDQLGRDVFSRVLTGARTSLGIGIGGVLFAFLVGVPLGMIAAYRGGRLDFLLMRGIDIMLSFPDIILALAIVAILGPNTQNVILAVGIVSVPVFARTSRAVTQSTLAEPYVEGSISLGCSPLRVMARHVLPNIAGILLTLASLLFATTLLAASGLSFLGLGTQPPEPEWGTMLGESRSYLRSHPHLATFPGLCLALSALGFNLLGEALRAVYDPTASPSRSKIGSIFSDLIGNARPARRDAVQDRTGAAQGHKPIETKDLRVAFFPSTNPIEAVRGISLAVEKGRTLAIVGESGSGKSTFLRAVATLLPRQAGITAGSASISGVELRGLSSKELQELRRKKIGVVFQDAASALNPVLTIGQQLEEAIRHGTSLSSAEARSRAITLLQDVKISDPERRLDMYPHQFSGGMKQRMVIAMALAQDPDVLLADEPTSALDVTVQQQILVLLRELQHRRGMTMLLVTHDLGLVARYADDVGVMYAGELVEFGTVDEVLTSPTHPYTLALKRSSPGGAGQGARERLQAISGEPPSVGRAPAGCPFEPRCQLSRDHNLCRSQKPARRVVLRREVACHFAEELADAPEAR